MRANHKFIILGFLIIGTLCSCGIIKVSESPESWGTSGGSYGAKQWTETNADGDYPTSDSVAMYCVSIGETGQKKFNWTYEQLVKSTDACTDAFVEGLR